jgi:nickel-dependent lactate racemase
VRFSLPYGRSMLSCQIPKSFVVYCASPRRWRIDSRRSHVKTALEYPIGLPRLRRLASHSRKAVIVTCDKTRGLPSHVTIPAILHELESGGLDRHRVEVLVATGLHKGETIADVKERLGGELVEDLTVSIHDSDDQGQIAFLGRLSSGVPLYLNRTVVDSDLVIVESTVEPHFFAGFTGGSKVILPGVAGTETILANHNWRNVDDSRSRCGVTDNPVRFEANESSRYLRKLFSLNIILDSRKRIVHASSGDIIASFKMSARAVDRHSRLRLKDQPDLVITSNGGYPLDRNVYQSVKGIAVPEHVLEQDSKIVMVSECIDGVGHQEFLNLLASDSPSRVYERLRASQTMATDQWEVQVLCRILRRNPVWFVTRSELRSEIEKMHMHYAPTIEEALASAGAEERNNLLVVPYGPSTILTM